MAGGRGRAAYCVNSTNTFPCFVSTDHLKSFPLLTQFNMQI